MVRAGPGRAELESLETKILKFELMTFGELIAIIIK